ncbi:hypothetical protein Tco_0257166 [Tanacetum coccineum]
MIESSWIEAMQEEIHEFERLEVRKVNLTCQATIVSEEQLVPRANRLVINKNNQRVTSDSDITDTMMRFVGIVHSANLDFASLIWDEFKWQAVDRTLSSMKMSKLIIDHFLSCNKSIPRRSDVDMHSEGQDSPLTKLINIVVVNSIGRIEIPYTMINDAIRQSVGYMYYKHKKEKCEKGKAVEEPEEQHMYLVKSGRGKGYMRLGNQEVNVPSVFKKNVVPRKQRSITIADNLLENKNEALTIERQVEKDVEDAYAAEKGLTLKGVVSEDPFEDISVTNSDATRDSSCSDTDEEKDDETDDFDMDISVDDDKRDEDDAAGFRAFDPPNDHEGETRKIRRKGVGKPSSRSSKKNNSHVVPDSLKRSQDHILGPSTIAVAKKLKELIQKDELTIADLEGAGLEKLKKQYKNDVELEYHIDQLKAAMLTKA